MKEKIQKTLNNLNESNWGCLLTLIIIGVILGSVGLQGLINGFLIVVALSIILPIIGFGILRWWLQRNLQQDNCPVCNYRFTAINNRQCRCPDCGEVLEVKEGKFQRLTPEGTIEVKAVDLGE